MSALDHPVDVALARYREPGSAAERLAKLTQVLEMRLRIDALLLAGCYLRSNRSADEKVHTLLLSRNFQLGQWYTLLQALVATVRDTRFPGIAQWFLHHERAGMVAPIAQAVSIRNRGTHDDGRFSPGFQDDALGHAERLVLPCLDEHPDLGPFEAQGDRVFLSLSGSECGPFLRPGHLVGRARDLLCYRGAAGSRLAYSSLAGREYFCEKAYHEVVAALRGRASSLEVLDATLVDTELLAARVASTSRVTVDRVTGLRQYRPEACIDRAETDEHFRAFLADDRPLLVVDGAAATGKSTWLCRKVEARLGRGECVLFETMDRLGGADLLDGLGASLRLRGGLPAALERLGPVTPDGCVVVALDAGAGLRPDDERLGSLFHWVERLPAGTPIRIILTCRAEQWAALQNRAEGGVPSTRLRRATMGGLTALELERLSEALPGGHDSGVLASRRELVGRMAASVHASLRRPGLAAPILEAIVPGVAAPLFSAARFFEGAYQRDILELQPDGRARRPWRGRILRELAAVLCDRGLSMVPLDDDALAPLKLIDPQSGRCSDDYEALVATGVLIETVVDLVPNVSFANPGFRDFVAALSLPLDRIVQTVPHLCGRSAEFPSALSIAAHLVVRAAGTTRTADACAAVIAAGPRGGELLLEMAALDGTRALDLYKNVASHLLDLGLEFIEQLFQAGEIRLASGAAQWLVQHATARDLRWEAQRLLLRSHYELDDYAAAAALIDSMGSDPPLSCRLLQAEIEVSRGAFQRAANAWEAVLAGADALDPGMLGHIWAGLGYTLGRMGQHARAEEHLRKAVAILVPRGDSRKLAEAWCDLGEVLGDVGRIVEARACFDASLAINRRVGLLVGQGIVVGMLGAIDAVEGDLESALERLHASLEIARRVGNRWREAWCLERLAEVQRADGHPHVADALAARARRLFEEIGVDRG